MDLLLFVLAREQVVGVMEEQHQSAARPRPVPSGPPGGWRRLVGGLRRRSRCPQPEQDAARGAVCGCGAR